MHLIPKKKKVENVELLEANDKVDELESRVTKNAKALHEVITDPWSRGILRTIRKT